MKTVILLLAFLWPALSFSQSPAELLLYQAEEHLNKGDDSSALVIADSALYIVRSQKDYLLESRAYYLIGKAYFKLGYPEDAAAPLQKALEIHLKIKNDSLAVNDLILLSAAMGDRENPQIDSSLFYLEIARTLTSKSKDTFQLAKIYINIANALDIQEKYKESIEYNKLCRDLLEKTTYYLEKGQNLHGMGSGYLNLFIEDSNYGHLQEAKKCFEEAVKIFQDIKEPVLESYAHNGAGVAATYMEDFPKARNELIKGLEISRKEGDSAGMINVYYNMATLAEMTGKWSEASQLLKALKELLDKVGNIEDKSFIWQEFTNRNLIGSKGLIEGKLSIFDKNQKNETIRYASIVGNSCLLLCIIGAFFYYRQKIRADRALAAEKEKLLVEELENRLKTQEIEFVRARLEGENLGRQKVARIIHDGVGSLLISAKWNLESAVDELSEKQKKVADRINENIRLQNESYQELRRVVYQLEHERVPWWQDLQKFCERLTGTGKAHIRFFPYNLDENVGGTLGEEARLVTQELITNALKHAEASEITVQISRVEDILSIVVEDNGKGFDPDTVARGVGMNSIQERVERLGGEASFDSGKGAGTSVFIDIPIQPANIMENNSSLYAEN